VAATTPPGLAPLNVWTKVAMWYDGTTMHIYTNDNEHATAVQTVTPDWTGNYSGTQIGNNPNGYEGGCYR